ncbi:hypothetical protein [Faecalibacter macacae]|uniref:Uncharacterized protein n=1 Tax=Faecalibacter macacae TaxID=1859289 RepID=A0A3L9M7A3_9FLAO|nr:hypothetical protein [Faecalibacter macacae]RLZ07806.1 hypothetical protein EAH69_11115 [Faecalibacter macacae]
MNEIDQKIYEYNNKPDDRFSGLSPYELHELIHLPFRVECPIQLQNEIDSKILDKIPFFKICEEFLKILQREKFIKLTPLGALPKKIIVELYSYKYITDHMIESGISKLSREQDSIAIQNAKFVCEIAKLTKKREGKLSLTKIGEKQLVDRQSLFRLILTTFSFDFNWAINDGYPDEPIAQYGNLYTIYCLLKFGKTEKPTQFYADKYLQIFEKFLPLFNDSLHSKPEQQFSNCFEIRSFYRFTDWFGFTQTTDKKYGEINNTKTTEILDKVYKFTHKKE